MSLMYQVIPQAYKQLNIFISPTFNVPKPNGSEILGSIEFQQVMLAIRHDAIRHRPHTMRTSYHGMDINVDSIQIVDFLVPKITAEVGCQLLPTKRSFPVEH